MKPTLFLLLCFLIPGVSQGTTSEDNLQPLVETLVELRKETELLNEEYESRKDALYGKLKKLAAQKAELEASLTSERLRKRQIQKKIDQYKKDLSKISATGEELMPVAEKYAEQLNDHIERSLPVKTSERTKATNDIINRMKAGDILPSKAIILLWSLYEDERRMTSEVSLLKQNVEIDGKMQLADVVKVGMFTMYFKTDQGDMGQAVPSENGWSWQVFRSSDQVKQASEFFVALKKQIRTGYFEIPMVL